MSTDEKYSSDDEESSDDSSLDFNDNEKISDDDNDDDELTRMLKLLTLEAEESDDEESLNDSNDSNDSEEEEDNDEKVKQVIVKSKNTKYRKKTKSCDSIKLEKPESITVPTLSIPRFPLKQLQYMLKMTKGSECITMEMLLTSFRSNSNKKKIHLTTLQRAKILSERVEQIDKSQDLFIEPPPNTHSSKDMAYYEYHKGVLPTEIIK
jgi:hypothetical protein